MTQGKEHGKVIYQEDNNGYHFYSALCSGISKLIKDFTHVDSLSPFLLGQLKAVEVQNTIEITTTAGAKNAIDTFCARPCSQ